MHAGGIPKMWWYGVFDTKYQALVIDLYSNSLREVLRHHNGSLPLSTIVKVAIQLLPVLENIHNHSIVHRDIKPHNIGINGGGDGGGGRRGGGRRTTTAEFFIYDFGLSKTYMLRGNKHITFRDNKGTCMYYVCTTCMHYYKITCIRVTVISNRAKKCNI